MRFRIFAAGLAMVALSVIATGPMLLSGCTRTVEREAEKRINPILTQYIGPAEKWETRVRGESAGAVMRGRVKSVHIEGTNVQLHPDLTAAKLTLDFAEVEVDKNAGRLTNVGSASFTCRIGEAVIDRYCRKLRPDIKDLKITLRGDAFVVTARPDNLRVVSVPVSLEGRLVPRDISRLDFDPDRAKLTILPVPELVLDYIARRLNPAIDLTHLPIRLQFTRSEVRGGYLILSGTVPPDDLVRASGQPLARPE
jgi:hypothetical protein